MNSLFWKILISFWLALILFVGLTLWSTSYYLEKVRTEDEQTHPREKLYQYSQQAREAYQAQGKEGLYKWINELDKREAVPYLFVDQNGKDIMNRSVPLQIKQRIIRYNRRMQHKEHDDDEDEKHNYNHHNKRTIVIKNSTYRLIPDFQNVTLSRLLNRPKVIAIPFFIATLISGIVCFLLARYLTRPISQLRLATRKISEGDLSQRVSPLLGNRQDELSGLAHDFDVMTEQLQRLINSHKQLLRDTSHELRSPLARLQVALGLAQQRNQTEITTELDRIELEIERLNEIIGQLLSLSRLDDKSALTDPVSIDITELVTEISKDAAYEARAKNRDVIITGDVSAHSNANRALLHSALENVIRNAIRYTKEHSTVEVSLAIDPDNVKLLDIKVRDHGPGIPDDMLERIFEPFVRVGEARDRDSGGYGLGLAIASRAIQLHNGQIKAINEKEGGMTIIIKLPITTS